MRELRDNYTIRFFVARFQNIIPGQPYIPDFQGSTYKGSLEWAEMVQRAYGYSYTATHPLLHPVESIYGSDD